MANFNFNKVILGGRITQNPELKQTQSGIMVLSFSIAVNRRPSRNEDGTSNQPQADFINCVAWRQTAEFISRYFRKGSSICIVGQIQTRNYTDQQGNKRYVTEVLVDEAMFVDSKSENPGGYNQSFSQPAQGGGAGYVPSSYNSEPQYSTPVAPPQGGSANQNGSSPNFEVLEGEDDLPF